eukprot:UN25395
MRNLPKTIKKCDIIYIRIFKTGSTTMASIIRNIAEHHGMKSSEREEGVPMEEAAFIPEEPGYWNLHRFRFSLQPDIEKLKFPYFVYTMLRDPVDRCLSAYNYKFTEHNRRDIQAKKSTKSVVHKKEYFENSCVNMQHDYIKINTSV